MGIEISILHAVHTVYILKISLLKISLFLKNISFKKLKILIMQKVYSIFYFFSNRLR